MVALLPMMLASPAALAASGTVIESSVQPAWCRWGITFTFTPSAAAAARCSNIAARRSRWGGIALSYIGVEKTASGYQVALRVPGADQYTVWNTDSNGNVVSNGTGGVVVSGSSSVLKSLEPSFQQDLNGDGIIGSAAAPRTVIESFGSTSLVQVGNNFYFYPVGGSSGPLFKYTARRSRWDEYSAELHRGRENSERLSSRTSCPGRGPVHGLEHRQQRQCRFQRDRRRHRFGFELRA